MTEQAKALNFDDSQVFRKLGQSGYRPLTQDVTARIKQQWTWQVEYVAVVSLFKAKRLECVRL